MKFLSLTTALICSCFAARAVSFSPNPADLGDLDHRYAETWGISYQVPAGEKIVSAKLTIKNIWDWKFMEQDALFIHLLDDPKLGVTNFADNTADNVISDYFGGKGVLLTTYSDPIGGFPLGYNLVYNFTAANIATLNSYLTDPKASGNGDFGFGFDADCHYYNDGITFDITTSRVSVPDAGSTLLLLGVGLLGLRAMAPRMQAIRK